jgi:hypothetical protein
MSALDQLEEGAHLEVQLGKLRFRLRRVTSAVMRDSRTLLLAIATPSTEDIVAEAAVAELPEDERPAKLAQIRRDRLTRNLQDPERMGRAQEVQAAVVRASVVAVANGDGGGWEPVQIVPSSEPMDRTSSPPRLPEHYLPQDMLDALYVAAWGHSTGSGGDAARLASFRGGS